MDLEEMLSEHEDEMEAETAAGKTSAYVNIRQHTSAYVSARQHTYAI